MAEIFGVLTLLGSGGAFYYAKSKYDNSTKFYKKIRPQVIEVSSTARPESIKNGSLIYINNRVSYNNPILTDPLLQTEFQNCPAISRRVEMLQYENDDSIYKFFYPSYWIWGESTRWYGFRHYSCSKISMENRNPEFPFSTNTFFASEISVGPFKVYRKELEASLNLNTRITVRNDNIKRIPLPSIEEDTEVVRKRRLDRESFSYSYENRLKDTRQGCLMLVLHPDKTTVGDLKISYYSCPDYSSGRATLIGRKSDGFVDTFNSKDGKESFFFLNFGDHSLDDAFAQMNQKAFNSFLWWSFFSGIVFIFGGVVTGHAIKTRISGEKGKK